MIRRFALALLLTASAAANAAGGGFTIAGEPFAQADILDARTVPDGSGAAALLITFQPRGAAHLKALTAAHVGQPMALDGARLAEAKLSAPIEDGQLQLSGAFGGFDQAAALAKRISGKDPLPEEGD